MGARDYCSAWVECGVQAGAYWKHEREDDRVSDKEAEGVMRAHEAKRTEGMHGGRGVGKYPMYTIKPHNMTKEGSWGLRSKSRHRKWGKSDGKHADELDRACGGRQESTN